MYEGVEASTGSRMLMSLLSPTSHVRSSSGVDLARNPLQPLIQPEKNKISLLSSFI